MDYLNLIVLAGRLAAPPEVKTFDSGSRLVRYLLTVRTGHLRSRVDVIPIVRWDTPDDDLEDLPDPGRGLWVTGMVQRRFWDSGDGRRSRLEVVAHHIQVRPDAGEEDAVACGVGD